MAARSIASLTVSFGLVSIPVKLFSATEASKSISFNMLHKACGSRLKQQYICIKEEVVVPREEMVKGYEFAKDQYVMFTPEELKAMEEVGTHTADITEFVPLDSVDPVYFDKAYYLAPDKGGAKPYALLAAALRESNKCALGRWAARGKQYIVMLRPVEDGIVMQQLLNAEEVRSIKDIEIPDTEVKPQELKLAQMLIEQQSAETFDPSAVQGHGHRAHRGGDREEGAGPGDHARRARGARARRSSTSWRRCARRSSARRPRKSAPGRGRVASPRPPASPRSARSKWKPAAEAPAPRKVARGKR